MCSQRRQPAQAAGDARLGVWGLALVRWLACVSGLSGKWIRCLTLKRSLKVEAFGLSAVHRGRSGAVHTTYKMEKTQKKRCGFFILFY